MWVICGIISVVAAIAGLLLALRKHAGAAHAATASPVFVSLTLLMQYRLVLQWVGKADWAALEDVVPSMFPILAGYVIALFAVNAVSLCLLRRKR